MLAPISPIAVAPDLAEQAYQAILDAIKAGAMALFGETSPGPVKYAASLLGKATEFCRLPLAPVMAPTRERVRKAMTDAGLLN